MKKKTNIDAVITTAAAAVLALYIAPWGLYFHAKVDTHRIQKTLDASYTELAASAFSLGESHARVEELEKGQSVIEESLKAVYAGEFFCTAYCTEKYPHICGEGHGITASGQPVQAGVTVAADTSVFPFGTVLYIEGVGIRIVQDIGGAVEGNHLDVAVDTHENALNWAGYGSHRVYVLEVADSEV